MGKTERLSLYLPVLVSAALYVFVSYFLERHERVPLMLSYLVLFGCYLWLVYKAVPCSVTHFIFVGLAFRLLLLLAMPNLSDDIFRFVWDGKLLANGMDPFAELPAAYAQGNNFPAGISQNLYHKLNSPGYFTIYPPFAQLVFFVSVVLSPDSILGSAVIMRLLIILAEVGTIYYLLKLADIYRVNKTNILWYALNPLVILELTGNLHFEAFLIFFLVAGLYFLLKNGVVRSAIFFALAVAVKLIPLMLLPLMIRRLEWPKLWRFYAITGLFILLAFTPLPGGGLINGMQSSITLYFQKFEFNASIYYLIREIGFAVKGYNIIGDLGPFLALTLFVLIMGFALVKRSVSWPKAILAVLTMYLLLSTTVHPWYITTLLAFSVLTEYRFVVVWSLLIFLTYIGYTDLGYHENFWITGIEYGVVIVYMLYEIFKNKEEKQAVECA